MVSGSWRSRADDGEGDVGMQMRALLREAVEDAGVRDDGEVLRASLS